MRLAVNAFSHDISLAAAGQQKLRYMPGAEAPSGRAADPAVYHPQGIADALLDNLLGAMIDRSSSPRLLPYPSFLQANLGDGRLRAGPLLNADYLLRDFSIAERPILWRILTVQAALYAAIQIVSSGDLEILSIERLLAQEDVAGLALDEGTTMRCASFLLRVSPGSGDSLHCCGVWRGNDPGMAEVDYTHEHGAGKSDA